MTTKRLATHLLLASTLLPGSALAQVRFCVGGSLDQLSPQQRATCSTKAHALRQLAVALHAPEDWHFVLVCGEEGWADYSAYATGDATTLQSRVADTNIEGHETFLREAMLPAAELTSVDGIMAHEIATALLSNKDEHTPKGVAHTAMLLTTREGS